ncbi:MAG: SpoIIE family protein phosphatase [Bacteroidetes bacterium]|jgi:serine phosphatase RsbU (regulator of sigma subunit)|nr:SpoIIE family protein phosphatase [Bacteroidota bacterium]
MSAFVAFRQHLARVDLVLGAAAIVGLLLYLFGLPAQHPDATAAYTQEAASIEERADAFLAASGWDVPAGPREVALRRNNDLLDDLQAKVGRPEAMRLLREQPDGPLPGYTWRVRYRTADALSEIQQGFQAGGGDAEDQEDEATTRATVHLTEGGAVWDAQYVPPEDGPRSATGPRLDRSVLRAVFPREEPEALTETADDAHPLSTLSDSLLEGSLLFYPSDTTWKQVQTIDFTIADLMERAESVLAAEQDGRPPSRDAQMAGDTIIVVDRSSITLPPGSAVAIARQHLTRTAWPAEAFRVDSVRTLPDRGDRVARVRFVREASAYQQRIQVDVEVTAGGALRQLDAAFNPGADDEHTLQTVADVTEAVVLGLLALILVILFFKRLSAQLIDNVVIRVDGILIGVLTALSVLLALDVEPGADSFWVALGIQVLIAGFSGGLVGLVVGIMAGAADSVARAEWSKKVYTASLLRLGELRNVHVGKALLRGIALALVLVGLHVLLLMVLPDAAIRFEKAQFANAHVWQPSLWITVQEGLGAYFTLVVLLLGTGTFVWRVTERPWVLMTVIVGTAALVQGGIVSLGPPGYAWAAGALVGLVLGGAFWTFDFVTCFVAYFVARVLWAVSEGWLVAGSPMVLDVVVIALLLGALLVLGFLGVSSGRSRREVGDYVPQYVEELTRQERLKRELEIAQQVQNSFLPRRMPDVAGVDVAAMCLAAQEVGGDYYDLIEIEPGHLAVVVGDVSGKGIQAAFYMTLVKGMLQALCTPETSPAEVMTDLNRLFYRNVPRGTFISMIYGVLDVEARTFTFARAGHNPVILKRSPSQHSEFLQPSGMALGLVDGGQFESTIEEARLDLRMGDVLVFYTDGFSEAMNLDKDQYGDDRLADKVSSLGQKSASAILHAVAEDVHHFVEGMGRHDDMTMLVLKLSRRTGGGL